MLGLMMVLSARSVLLALALAALAASASPASAHPGNVRRSDCTHVDRSTGERHAHPGRRYCDAGSRPPRPAAPTGGGYDRSAFRFDGASAEDARLRELGLSPGRTFLSFYTCTPFTVESRRRGRLAADTDVDHVVSLREAHDSGLRPADRVRFAADGRNHRLATPSANRSKGARDAARWTPRFNAKARARIVLNVKAAYGLSIDPAERAALEAALAGPDAPCPRRSP